MNASLSNPAEIEALEARLANAGSITETLSYVPSKTGGPGAIYLGDARDYVDESLKLVNVDQYVKGKVLAAAGKREEAEDLKIFTDLYWSNYDGYEQVMQGLENASKPYYSIFGAAATKTTQYETTRRTNDILQVTGEQYTNEEYQAINAAKILPVGSNFKFKNHTKTSSKLIVQKEIGDDIEPTPARQTFSSADFEIFADAFHYRFSMRDKAESVFPLEAEIQKEIPGMFLRAKNEKVVTLLEAISGTNQGDWDAVSGSFYTSSAPADVQTFEDAVKPYQAGGKLVAVFEQNSWRAYMKNWQGVVQTPGPNLAKSTSGAMDKSGTLPGNPNVTYYIDDAITDAEYMLVAQESWCRGFQGAVIQTSYKNSKTPGQMEGKIYLDFNGFRVQESSAGKHGESVTT